MRTLRDTRRKNIISLLTSSTTATALDCDVMSLPSPRWTPDWSCVERATVERCRRYPASRIVFAICARPSLGGCHCTLCKLLCRSLSTATWRLKRRQLSFDNKTHSRERSGALAKLPLCRAEIFATMSSLWSYGERTRENIHAIRWRWSCSDDGKIVIRV